MTQKAPHNTFGIDDLSELRDNLPSLPGVVHPGEDGPPGGMERFNNYTKLDVNAKKRRLKEHAATFVKELADLYLNTDSIQRPEYVESVSKIESMNLAMLLGQVTYAEHALDTIMQQLDNGGYMDMDIYDLIMKLQSSAVKITLQVAQYVRTLPEYFASLEQDITKYTSIDMINTGTANVQNIENGEPVGDITPVDEYSSSGPIRGMKNLLLQIENGTKELNNVHAHEPPQQAIGEQSVDVTELSESDIDAATNEDAVEQRMK